MEELLQTSLYLFSALLQADAALLGFGTIFVVFRIQSLESKFQLILQSYNTHPFGGVNTNVRKVLLGNASDVASVLHREEDYNLANYSQLVCIPEIVNQIKASIKKPILIIGTHAIFSSILLFISYKTYVNEKFQFSLMVIAVLWFSYNIYSAITVAIRMLSSDDNYKIEGLRPDISEELDKLDKDKS
jgi:hypothetical protein